MRFDTLYDFGLIVRHGGLGAASRATGRSKSTLSRRIFDLEEDLGVGLFQRTSGKMLLTEPGKVLFASSCHALGALEKVMTDVATEFGEAGESGGSRAFPSSAESDDATSMRAGS